MVVWKLVGQETEMEAQEMEGWEMQLHAIGGSKRCIPYPPQP